MRKTIRVLLLMAMLVAACSGDATDGDAEVPPTADISDGFPLADDDGANSLGMGPGISVADALDSTLDEPLLVNGYLFVYADGSVVLADLIAESFPPQPSGATVAVEGIDLMQFPLTEGPDDGEIEITAWTEVSIQLLGEVVDGSLVVSTLATG